MSISKKARGLKCALCHRGLLKQYKVYDVPTDEFGNCGAPEWYSDVTGYFYSKNSRGSADAVEVAGEIGGSSNGVCSMLVFPPVCKTSDLVEIGGLFYRVTNIRDIYSVCGILDLEVYPYENQV